MMTANGLLIRRKSGRPFDRGPRELDYFAALIRWHPLPLRLEILRDIEFDDSCHDPPPLSASWPYLSRHGACCVRFKGACSYRLRREIGGKAVTNAAFFRCDFVQWYDHPRLPTTWISSFEIAP